MLRAQPVCLDWREGAFFDEPEPCVLCGKATGMRSPLGVPCHKVCAERWYVQAGYAQGICDRCSRAALEVPTDDGRLIHTSCDETRRVDGTVRKGAA